MPTWRNRAERAIAHGALTNSKRPSAFVDGVYPTHISRAHGAHVWDGDGKKYLDFCCANGSNLVGYGHVTLAEAAFHAYREGSLFSLGSTTEVQAAEKAKELWPSIDKLRFLKTGTEACAASVRIARAATGRKIVLSEGYHGWADGFTAMTPPAHGCVPGESWPFRAVEDINKDVAAVIVEPINLDSSLDRKKFLYQLRARCTEVGALLIYDEVITGFRVPKLSVARLWGVRPDLIVLGKAIGGGLPLAIVGGKSEVMECADEYFVSSTFAGDRVALSTFMALSDMLHSSSYQVAELWDTGLYFLERFNRISELVQIEGYPTRGAFRGHPEVLAKFWQECCKAGILFGASWFWCFAHRDIQNVIEVCEEAIWKVKRGVQLEGKPPQSPFASKVRSQSG